jgi:hypothetical protein
MLDFAPPVWNELAGRRHRRRGPRQLKMWDRSILTAQTGTPDQPSLYDPNLTDQQISLLEMACVPGSNAWQSNVAIELPRTLPHVRMFYRRHDQIVGASNGKRTEYIIVKYNSDGSVHGYPVTSDYLKSKGADL